MVIPGKEKYIQASWQKEIFSVDLFFSKARFFRFLVNSIPVQAHAAILGTDCLHRDAGGNRAVVVQPAGASVRLCSRPGNDLTRRFPLIVETLAPLAGLAQNEYPAAPAVKREAGEEFSANDCL